MGKRQAPGKVAAPVLGFYDADADGLIDKHIWADAEWRWNHLEAAWTDILALPNFRIAGPFRYRRPERPQSSIQAFPASSLILGPDGRLLSGEQP